MRQWYHTKPRPPFAKPHIRRVQFGWHQWDAWTVEQHGCIRYYFSTYRAACRFALHLWQQDYLRRILENTPEESFEVAFQNMVQ